MGFVARSVTLFILLYCQVCNFTHIVWPQAFQHYFMGKILFCLLLCSCTITRLWMWFGSKNFGCRKIGEFYTWFAYD